MSRTPTFHRSGARLPVCDYGFDAAHKLALAEWHSWVGREAEASTLLARADNGRRRVGARRCGVASLVASVRCALGILLIRVGQRVQGDSARHSVAADAPADGKVC